jgi:hypothetical protein
LSIQNLSKSEKRRAPSDALLLSRRDAAALVGVSVARIMQLEKAGKLRGFRLSESPTAMKFFLKADVLRLIEEASNAR